MLLLLLYFLDLLPFAVFFGMAVYMWMAPFYAKLSAQAFIEFFQGVDPYMKVWAKRLVLSQLLLTLVLVVATISSGRWTVGALTLGAFV